MRARGANATDIVVLVVAADDGVMPQTIEAIDHAKAAEVPIVVAVNKIDRPDANPERVRQELTTHGLQPEEWGGQTIFVDVSAREKTGLSNLLEMLLLQADVLELKANPNADASGLIIESRLDIGRGPVATLLVQRGTMHPGVRGRRRRRLGQGARHVLRHGRAAQGRRPGRARRDPRLRPSAASPASAHASSTPSGRHGSRPSSAHSACAPSRSRAARRTISLEHLFDAVKAGGIRELNLIIKADVQGSVEAALGEVQKIKSDEVAVRVIHTGVGAIVESDINLAAASTAIVVGFNVRPNAEAKALADREGVDVRTYRVIYQLTEDIEKALVGLLAPDTVEDVLGEAEVRALFRSSRLGVIAGCMVTTGKFERSARVRVVREGALVWDGNIGSLRRVQEDVREVAAGFECGILLEGYNDLKEGDVLECYVTRQVERSSLASVAGAST